MLVFFLLHFVLSKWNQIGGNELGNYRVPYQGNRNEWSHYYGYESLSVIGEFPLDLENGLMWINFENNSFPSSSSSEGNGNSFVVAISLDTGDRYFYETGMYLFDNTVLTSKSNNYIVINEYCKLLKKECYENQFIGLKFNKEEKKIEKSFEFQPAKELDYIDLQDSFGIAALNNEDTVIAILQQQVLFHPRYEVTQMIAFDPNSKKVRWSYPPKKQYQPIEYMLFIDEDDYIYTQNFTHILRFEGSSGKLVAIGKLNSEEPMPSKTVGSVKLDKLYFTFDGDFTIGGWHVVCYQMSTLKFLWDFHTPKDRELPIGRATISNDYSEIYISATNGSADVSNVFLFSIDANTGELKDTLTVANHSCFSLTYGYASFTQGVLKSGKVVVSCDTTLIVTSADRKSVQEVYDMGEDFNYVSNVAFDDNDCMYICFGHITKDKGGGMKCSKKCF